MNLGTVIQRIRDQAPSFSNRVAGAAELELALESSEVLTLPHAYVLPTSETASGSAIDEEILVVVVVDASADDRGQAGAQSLEGLRGELFDALQGWSPSSSHRPMRYVSGAFFDTNRHALFYGYNFAGIRELEGLFRFVVSLSALVATDSTPATVLGNWATAIEAAISGITRLGGDHAGDELAEGLAAGSAGYALRGLGGGSVPDSNDRRIVLWALATVYYRLGASEAERDFTEGDMQTWAADLLDPATWRVAGVQQIVDDPQIEYPSDVVRT